MSGMTGLVPMSLCPYVPMSRCPYVPMSLCPYVPVSLCPDVRVHALWLSGFIPFAPNCLRGVLNGGMGRYPRCNSYTLPSLAPWDYPSDNACTGVESPGFAAMGYSIRTDRWRCE